LNILIIKQSSLGDVLHSTGHVRTIRENFPGSTITLLTAERSYEIFKHDRNVDKVLLFEKDRAKREWRSNPGWVVRHVFSLLREVRRTHYDLAFDLQGRLKTVFFLYGARADRKYVKGRWLFLHRFRKPEIHAIEEMDQVLRMAGLHVTNSDMEIATSSEEEKAIDVLLKRINPTNKKILIMSPFTRWETKNWGLEKFKTVINGLTMDVLVIFTGLADRKAEIDQLVSQAHGRSVVNLAGELTLLELAELLKKSHLVVTGDSFPMHLASALHTPLIALFGPTDEKRVGYVGEHVTLLRAGDMCRLCYRRDRCRQNCITYIQPETVLREIHRRIGMSEYPG